MAEHFPLIEGSSQILNLIDSNHDITFEPNELERNIDCFSMMSKKWMKNIKYLTTRQYRKNERFCGLQQTKKPNVQSF